MDNSRLTSLLQGYRDGDQAQGIILIESAQMKGIIGREVTKYLPKYDQEEIIHQCELILLKLFDEIKITSDMNDGRIVSYINKVLPLRLIDTLIPKEKLISLEDNIPGTDIPIINTLESEEADPEEVFMRKEKNAELTAAMKRLTTNQQKILYMYYYEEKTQQEIATILKVSQPAVNKAMSRAITSMGRYMK